VDAGDNLPTKQQYEVFEELQKEAQPLLAQYHELMSKDLVSLNEMVNKQSVPVLYVPAKK
jgi:DNA-binding protein H-NS